MWLRYLNVLYAIVIALLVCFWAGGMPSGYQRPDTGRVVVLFLIWIASGAAGVVVYSSPRWLRLLLLIPTIYFGFIALYFVGLASSWN